MTHLRYLIALAVFLPPIALAQDVEHIAVEKDRGLAGLWQVQVPDRVSVNLFHSVKFGAMRNIYCRIGDDGRIDCLNGGYSRHGKVERDRDQVHIAWGSAMARFAIDGQMSGDTVSGTFRFKVAGIAEDAPELSRSVRFARPAGSANDEGEVLAQQLRSSAERPDDLAGLGTVEQVIYLGSSPNLNGRGGADYFQVYALEFAAGERICGLKRGENMLAALVCV